MMLGLGLRLGNITRAPLRRRAERRRRERALELLDARRARARREARICERRGEGVQPPVGGGVVEERAL